MRSKPTVKERVTAAQKADLIERRVTYAELARTIGCSLSHLSKVFPNRDPKETHKEMSESKRVLTKCRQEFRKSLAKQCLNKAITLKQAAKQANLSERQMRRVIENAKS